MWRLTMLGYAHKIQNFLICLLRIFRDICDGPSYFLVVRGYYNGESARFYTLLLLQRGIFPFIA
jgi:hypothetical protein